MRAPLIVGGLILSLCSGRINAQDASHGQDIFERRCAGCHSLDRDKEGPRLRGVYGRNAGGSPSFSYSDAVKNAKITWDDSTLNRWLTDPEKLVPGTDMEFRLTNGDERKQVIAYLKQMSSHPSARAGTHVVPQSSRRESRNTIYSIFTLSVHLPE